MLVFSPATTQCDRLIKTYYVIPTFLRLTHYRCVSYLTMSPLEYDPGTGTSWICPLAFLNLSTIKSMRRLSTITLGIALSLLVGAASLSLLAAAWLMATHALSTPLRWVAPVGLLLVLSALGTVDRVTAQPATPGAFTVVEERNRASDGQIRILYSITAPFDSVPTPVRGFNRNSRPAIRKEPTWPVAEPEQWEQSGDASVPRAFYIIATSPLSQPLKPGDGWLNIRPRF